MDNPRLLAILAHPDDETLGLGGTLAHYASQGVETFLLTATHGERGWFGQPEENPGLDALGRLRADELADAAQVLKLKEANFLDYVDGELDQADPDDILPQIVTHIRRLRPQVIITFDPYGIYGHPDHIAISQFTTAAVVAAADRDYPHGGMPHRVDKLYYRVATQDELEGYQAAFGDLVMEIDGVERRAAPWEDWAVTTQIDTRAYWKQVWQAVYCHRTQLPGYEKLLNMPEAQQKRLFGLQTFYRAFSFANGGRQIETDLFAGLATVMATPDLQSAR
ncbi:MAG: PIG-L family deacetylase [Anaerolineae bacterium]|nr:PIG-L family deacetylase [Anaerolineae bacterium]